MCVSEPMTDFRFLDPHIAVPIDLSVLAIPLGSDSSFQNFLVCCAADDEIFAGFLGCANFCRSR